MNVSLTPELEKLVNDKVSSGLYQTASEVIREGLRLLKERDQRMEILRSDVNAGFEAIRRGQFSEFDAASVQQLSERVKSRGRRRLAENERKTNPR